MFFIQVCNWLSLDYIPIPPTTVNISFTLIYQEVHIGIPNLECLSFAKHTIDICLVIASSYHNKLSWEMVNMQVCICTEWTKYTTFIILHELWGLQIHSCTFSETKNNQCLIHTFWGVVVHVATPQLSAFKFLHDTWRKVHAIKLPEVTNSICMPLGNKDKISHLVDQKNRDCTWSCNVIYSKRI